MWKWKELIRGESAGNRKKRDIDFESLDNNTTCNITDKFNLFYVQSINNLVKFIKSMEDDELKSRNGNAIC